MPERLLNVLCTFNLRPVCTGYLIIMIILMIIFGTFLFFLMISPHILIVELIVI